MVDPAPSHPTAGVLQAAQAGDRAAFDRLFAQATPRLRWYVDLRLGRGLRAQVEPDDVLQDTFAVAWERVAGFEDRGQGSFLRWLFALADNRIRGQASRQRRRRAQAPGPADVALALAADPQSGPCTRAARVERRLRVGEALAGLPEELEQVLLLRVLEGRSLSFVATRMGRSESAVRRLVAKATATLGQRLQGERSHG